MVDLLVAQRNLKQSLENIPVKQKPKVVVVPSDIPAIHLRLKLAENLDNKSTKKVKFSNSFKILHITSSVKYREVYSSYGNSNNSPTPCFTSTEQRTVKRIIINYIHL